MQAAHRGVVPVAYGRIANPPAHQGKLGAAMEFAGAAATAGFPTVVILCPWRGRGCLWFSGIGQASAFRSSILRHSGSWVGRQVSTARYGRTYGCPVR